MEVVVRDQRIRKRQRRLEISYWYGSNAYKDSRNKRVVFFRLLKDLDYNSDYRQSKSHVLRELQISFESKLEKYLGDKEFVRRLNAREKCLAKAEAGLEMVPFSMPRILKKVDSILNRQFLAEGLTKILSAGK